MNTTTKYKISLVRTAMTLVMMLAMTLTASANMNGETVTFAQPTRGGESEERIIIDLCNNSAVIDRAIIRLGEGETLPKLQIREGNTKIYLPQDGKEYAVVNADREGARTPSTNEMPINFKASENGTYTLTVNV